MYYISNTIAREARDCCHEQEKEDAEEEYSTIWQLKDKIQVLRRWNLKLTRTIEKYRMKRIRRQM
jgi:hypothetical protein